MHHVLLIEDSEECRLIAKRALSGPTISVTEASGLKDAISALAPASKYIPDLILLDLSLPDGDGFQLLDDLQSNDRLQKVPVFLMTGNKDLACKVTAFNLGAEDYLVKPVNPLELRARIEMRLRKLNQAPKTIESIQRGALTLHIPLMKAILADGNREINVELTAKEFKILLFLAQNEGNIYSRSQVVEMIWGKAVHVLDRTVDSHVCSLRRKLGEFSPYIESVPGSGYCFNSGASLRSQTSRTS